jgi:hypothetical protein
LRWREPESCTGAWKSPRTVELTRRMAAVVFDRQLRFGFTTPAGSFAAAGSEQRASLQGRSATLTVAIQARGLGGPARTQLRLRAT